MEDYYQTTPFKGVVGQGNWYRYESRLEPAIHKTLDLLDEFGAKATFFALGWVADAAPELLRLIVERGPRDRHPGLLPPVVRRVHAAGVQSTM